MNDPANVTTSPPLLGAAAIATAAAVESAFTGLSEAIRAAGSDPKRYFLEICEYAFFDRSANTPEEHKEVAARIIQEAQP
jgi:hypothetical protein